MDFKYWQKQTDQPLFPDVDWNLPEWKTGSLAIIGGSSTGFSAINQAVTTASSLPLKEIRAYLPDSLKSKIPANPTTFFAPANPSGGFSKSASATLASALYPLDLALFIGDLGKSPDTALAIAETIQSLKYALSILITRDTIDLLIPHLFPIIDHPHNISLIIFATMPQLQKIFHTLYYPKIIRLSMPLTQLIDTLHKFTITYPCTVITQHNGHYVVAQLGDVTTTDLKNTAYTPLSLFSGPLAVRLAAYLIRSPASRLESATTAILAK